MSVLWVRPIWEGRDADGDAKARRYQQTWKVRTDSKWDDQTVVLSHPSIPNYGAKFPNDLSAFCQKITASQESLSPYFWRVTANYSTEKELDENPLDTPAEITWDPEEFQRVLAVDADGNAVVNSAQDPYDPPVEVDDSRQIATVVKNVANVPSWILQYRNVVNSDAFSLDGISISAGQAKLKAIKISAWKRVNDVSFRTLTIPLNLDEDGWLVKVQDMGFYEIDATGVKTPIKINGKAVTVPWPLNGMGNAIPANQIPQQVVARDHKGYKERPFSVLAPLFL